MALHIMKDSAFLRDLSARYQEYATVKSHKNTGLKGLFGFGVGNVTVSFPGGPDTPLLRVTVPNWKGGKGQEWETLQQCYQTVLQKASEGHCEAIVLPLLAAEDPKFPASIDYKIAVETIREFLKTHHQDVYLMVFRQNTAPVLLRANLERQLSRHNLSRGLFESNIPFVPQEPGCEVSYSCAPSPSPAPEAPAQEEPHRSMGYMDYSELSYDASCGAADWEEEEKPRKASRKSPPKPALSASRPRMELPSVQRSRRPDLENLKERLKAADAGFSDTLLHLIDQTGKKDSEIYNKANVSRQHFSKIRNNPHYKPTKQTAIAFAIALELNLEQTKDLLGRAGYTLTNSSEFDIIITYFIQEGYYNMFDINETLYEYDQCLLGV